MTAEPPDIGGFIGARLDDEEADALAATPGPWHAEVIDGTGNIYGPDGNGVAYDREDGCARADDADHIARQNPAATLARVAALRAILDSHEMRTTPNSGISYCSDCCDGVIFPGPCATIRHVAAIWRDHPDYRTEWA